MGVLAVCSAVSIGLALICLYYILRSAEGFGGIETLTRIDFFGNLSSAVLKTGVFAAIVCDVFCGRKKKNTGD